MVDHGFDRTIVGSSPEDVMMVAKEISMARGVVAVHIVHPSNDPETLSLMILSNDVASLPKVIPKKFEKYRVEILSHEIWHSKISFRNGEKVKNAFI